MKKYLFLPTLILLFVAHIQAQEEITYEIPRWHIGVELGINPLFGIISYQPNIRDTRRTYLDKDGDYYGVYTHFGQAIQIPSFSIGIKPEYVIKNA